MASPLGFEDLNRSDRFDYESCEPERGRKQLTKGLGILQHWIDKKSTRVNGEPPKRRGPKPDSKPALTRRQELNRQAQRTHRERKELYIKALEQEVLRLKEDYTVLSRDRDAIAEENRQIKALLTQYNIPWTTVTGNLEEYTRMTSNGNLASDVYSVTHALGSQTYSPPQNSLSNSRIHGSMSTAPGLSNGSTAPCSSHRNLDYDQAGIDFVLTLERPCMDHMHTLIEQASEPGGRPCGHALMASCPPDPIFDTQSERPFGHHLSNLDQGAQKTWDVPKSDLGNLFNLSKRLNLDGEITPVMAWGMIQAHSRFPKMSAEDFEGIANELVQKVKCYGFGAVLEEFEVRDALTKFFYDKPLNM